MQESIGPTLTRLSEFLTKVTSEDLPTEVIERERRHVLDTLGCMLYGATTPWVEHVHRTLVRLDESGQVSIPGMSTSLPPARAALVGGTAAHAMDFDDHCQDAGVHAGSATVPTALAAAVTADRPVSGDEFLTAVAAGVEVGIRSGFGIGYGSVGQGWHIAGWTGAFAGAATTGMLFDLDQPTQAHALAVAGTQGCGLLGAQYGAAVKRFHMGKAAEAGYLGAGLAREGLTGDTQIFGERYGAIGPTMSDDYDTNAVTAALGSEYRLLDKLVFKPFPSVGQVHAPVDAVRAILEGAEFDGSRVNRVRCRVTPTVKSHVGWKYEPTDVMAAQANIGYAVASLLVDGELTIESFTADAIDRPAVLDRVDDIEVIVDESLAGETFGAVAEVEVGDEWYEQSIETPRGYPENPLSDEELEEKFRRQASHAIEPSAVNHVIELVRELPDLEDITVLVEPLTP
ncbi:MAG: MmgE/PrpD family protein [Salinirussus sp.]